MGTLIVLPSMLDLEMSSPSRNTRQLATNYSLPAQVSVFEHENRDVYAPDVSLAAASDSHQQKPAGHHSNGGCLVRVKTLEQRIAPGRRNFAYAAGHNKAKSNLAFNACGMFRDHPNCDKAK